MKHPSKMMWACAALLIAMIALVAAGATSAYLLIAIPCVLMMAGMVWMMVKGSDGRGH